METFDDGSIVHRVRGGDRQAYAELVRRHQSRLRSALSFYCRSAEEVEEFLQEAFVQAYTHLGQFDAALPFYPWLKTIALNALRMEIRRIDARKQPEEYLRHLQLQRLESDAAGTEADGRAEVLRRCLEKLPKPQAELLEAKYAEGRPLSELADRCGVTLGALKVRLLRIREALKECVNRNLALEPKS